MERCVPQEAENEAPRLAGGAASAPSRPRPGGALTLELTVDEPLHVSPTLAIVHNEAQIRLDVDPTASSTTTATFTFAAPANPGAWTASVAVLDEVGNGVTITVAGFFVDDTAPRLLALTKEILTSTPSYCSRRTARSSSSMAPAWSGIMLTAVTIAPT